jgi:hypothetical protein
LKNIDHQTEKVQVLISRIIINETTSNKGSSHRRNTEVKIIKISTEEREGDNSLSNRRLLNSPKP